MSGVITPRQSLQRFKTAYDRMKADQQTADLTLAVGTLLGMGLPTCAAAVALAADAAQPSQDWPWRHLDQSPPSPAEPADASAA